MAASSHPGEAFLRARLKAEELMNFHLRNSGRWNEDSVTDLLLLHAAPEVWCYRFHGREEGEVGADWLWWWIDESDESFGLLAQAKNLKRSGRRGYTIDFGYQGRMAQAPQIELLLAKAAAFGVPAAHVLYCGDIAYRADLRCDRHSDGRPCRDRDRAGVSIIASLFAQAMRHEPDAGARAYCSSVPLEDMARPLPRDRRILFPLGRDLPEEMRRFLLTPQSGARRVAKALLHAVHNLRLGQFSAALAERSTDLHGDTVFASLPNDRGHFSEPYLAHVLRGLRQDVPDYVRELLRGQTPPPAVTERVAGIVVIRLPEPGGASSPNGPPSRLTPARPPLHLIQTTVQQDSLTEMAGRWLRPTAALVRPVSSGTIGVQTPAQIQAEGHRATS